MRVSTFHRLIKKAHIKRLYRWIKHFLKRPVYFLDGMFIASPSIGKDIALVRLDAIGDFVLWLDAAKEYRVHYPDKKIILIANSLWSQLALEFPYWDEVWPIHPGKFAKNYFYRWKWLRRISKHGFDMAIQPTFSRQILTGDTVVRATNAPSKIGFDGDIGNATELDLRLSKKWYSRLLKSSSIPMMELERNGEFIKLLFKKAYSPAIATFPLIGIKNALVVDASQYCIIFPGAGWVGRMWPIAHFVGLIELIRQNYGLDVILCGSESERDIGEAISSRLPFRVQNFCGMTSLLQLINIIKGASFLVANETSAIHIAVAIKTPAVCILGGGHYGRFMPYPHKYLNSRLMVANEEMECFGCNWECSIRQTKDGAVPCIERITPDKVKKMIDNILF